MGFQYWYAKLCAHTLLPMLLGGSCIQGHETPISSIILSKSRYPASDSLQYLHQSFKIKCHVNEFYYYFYFMSGICIYMYVCRFMCMHIHRHTKGRHEVSFSISAFKVPVHWIWCFTFLLFNYAKVSGQEAPVIFLPSHHWPSTGLGLHVHTDMLSGLFGC